MHKEVVADISDKARTFKVYFDKECVGVDADWEETEVPAGEDADKWCGEVLQNLINNTCSSAWFEKGSDEDCNED